MNKVKILLMSFSVLLVLNFSCDSKEEYKDGLARVQDYTTKKYGFVDKSNELIIDKIYKVALEFNDGYCIVGNGKGKRGVINKRGEVVIPLKFDNVNKKGDYFQVVENLYKPNQLLGLIDNKNNTIIPLIAKKIRVLPDNYFLVELNDDKDNWYIYDKKGNKVSDAIGDYYYSESDNKNYEYYNNFIIFDNKIIYNLKNPSSPINGYYDRINFARKDKSQTGIIFKVHKNKNYNSEPKLLNYKGENFLQQGIYSRFYGKFSNGFIVAKISDLGEGFIDLNGNLIIKPIFDNADDFNKGIAKVTLHDKVFYIDTKGKCVQDCPSPQWFSYYKLDDDFSLNKKKYNIYLSEGLKQADLKNYDESIVLFSRAIREYPLGYDAHYNKSLSLYLIKDLNEALKEIDKAIALNPKKSDSYYIKGSIIGDYQLYKSSGKTYIKYSHAINEVIKAVDIAPYNLDYYIKLVYLSGKDGRRDMSCYFMKKGCDLGDYDLCKAFKKYCNNINSYGNVIKHIDMVKKSNK
jgi:tetratricopeptide (TPR) repeat protein